MERAIIFGVRGQGINCYLMFEKKYDIVAFAENDPVLEGRFIFGKRVILPKDIANEKYDIILISSQYWYDTLKLQLVDLGIPEDRISDEFLANSRTLESRWDFEMNRLCGIMINHGIRYCGDDYEAKWEKIKKKYKLVKLFMVYERPLGEFLLRAVAISKYEKEENDVFKVFIPSYYDEHFLCNIELIKALSNQIHFAYGEELFFWQYILKQKPLELDLSDFTKYMLRGQWKPIQLQLNEKLFPMDEQRLSEAMKKANSWGLIEDEYVCLGTRTAQYYMSEMGGDLGFDHRNCHFSYYQQTIDYLDDLGIKSVKMGRNELPDKDLRKCVDYAGLYADDFMDLALFSCCKFAIVTGTGMWQLPSVFGKPVLVVNEVGGTMGCGGIPYTDYDLYIPKKYKNKQNGKYLSLKEMAEIDRLCDNNAEKLNKAGIEFIENTPEEILEATKEFLLRLDGKWKDEEADIKNYKRYEEIMGPLFPEGFEKQIYHSPKECSTPLERVVEDMAYCFSSWCNRKGYEGGPIPCRISATYLRNNLYLLD